MESMSERFKLALESLKKFSPEFIYGEFAIESDSLSKDYKSHISLTSDSLTSLSTQILRRLERRHEGNMFYAASIIDSVHFMKLNQSNISHISELIISFGALVNDLNHFLASMREYRGKYRWMI